MSNFSTIWPNPSPHGPVEADAPAAGNAGGRDGAESTYLTSIDEIRVVQHVLMRAPSAMQIPEGPTVPWNDTLCKRALEEGRAFTDDVPPAGAILGAARDLGIRNA